MRRWSIGMRDAVDTSRVTGHLVLLLPARHWESARSVQRRRGAEALCRGELDRHGNVEHSAGPVRLQERLERGPYPVLDVVGLSADDRGHPDRAVQQAVPELIG